MQTLIIRSRFLSPVSPLSSPHPHLLSHFSSSSSRPRTKSLISRSKTIKTSVWWDLDCSVPDGVDLCLVSNRIGSALESSGIGSPISIKAYANMSKDVPMSAQKALSSSGISLFHIPRCQKHSIHSLLKEDILCWTMRNPAPANILLISNNYVRKKNVLCGASTLTWPWIPLAKGMAFTPWQFNDAPDAIYRFSDGHRKPIHDDSIRKPQKPTERGVKEKTSRTTKQPNCSLDSAKSEVASAPCQDKTKYEPLKFEGQIEYCRTFTEVERATLELLDKIKETGVGQVFLGLDVEWKPFRRGDTPNKAAVIQICGNLEYCYVMHVIHSGIPPILKSLLEDNQYVKVGLSITNDARKLATDYDVRLQPVRDIADLVETKLEGSDKNYSLSLLSKVLIEKELEKPKEIRMGDWETDLLSKDQIQYAATDAFASWYIFEAVVKK